MVSTRWCRSRLSSRAAALAFTRHGADMASAGPRSTSCRGRNRSRARSSHGRPSPFPAIGAPERRAVARGGGDNSELDAIDSQRRGGIARHLARREAPTRWRRRQRRRWPKRRLAEAVHHEGNGGDGGGLTSQIPCTQRYGDRAVTACERDLLVGDPALGSDDDRNRAGGLRQSVT